MLFDILFKKLYASLKEISLLCKGKYEIESLKTSVVW